MYSSLVIDRRLHAMKKKRPDLVFKRLPRDKSIEIAASLEKLRLDPRGKLIPDNQTSRPLQKGEEEFIASEQILCKSDFEYFFTRYYNLRLDAGVIDGPALAESKKIGPPVLLESQRRYINLLGRRELECMEEQAKHRFTLGIHAYFHKVRQVAATATARAIALHRMLFWPGSSCFAASLDEPRVTELFSRDHLAIDKLPFWLAPRVYPDVKNEEIGFEHPISTRCLYQAENQQQGRGGLGVGMTLDISHLTEVALWVNPGFIDFSLWPAIPKSISTLHVQESTANGRGNYWYDVTEAARHKKRGYEHWVYAFIPWYYNMMKYRAIVPSNWSPSEHTIKHAALIERTSPEFNDGVTVHPSIEQLYWWESTRAAHVHKGELDIFLTNYPATPEQSFQNPLQGALPPELLEEMETDASWSSALPYEVETAAA